MPAEVGTIDVVGQNVRRAWRREGDTIVVSLHQPVLGAATLLRRNLAIYGLGGVIVPFIGIKLIDLALVALGLARALGLSQGDATLLMVLAASASYIAVPAVVRYAIPEANPSLYVGLSLGLTFPLNILLGITCYTQVAAWALG